VNFNTLEFRGMWQMKKIGVFVGLILLTVVLSLTGILGDLRTAIGQSPPTPPVGSGIKLCSVVTPNSWRDSISVPASWTFINCADYARLVGAKTYELGCVFGDRVSLPPTNRSAVPQPTNAYPTPDPNCGW
jgi:hypothetical protein